MGAGLCTHGGVGKKKKHACLPVVVTRQRRWHGSDVEKLKLCMDYGQKVYMEKFLSIALLQKKTTRVFSLGTRTNFLYLLFYIPEMTNLTMLFNVLLTTMIYFS